MKLLVTLSIALFTTATAFAQNCDRTSTGLPPLTDLGTGQYKGYTGGLYPNGANTLSGAHLNAGLEIASQIKPLNTNGMPDKSGKIVWLSIGMSNTTQESQVFLNVADSFSGKNSNLVLVDGAQGGEDINIIIDPKADYWTVVNNRLVKEGLTPAQVQIVWFKEAEKQPQDSIFPNHANSFKAKVKTVMQLLKEKFPNVKMCYLTSRIYAGYATSLLNPEPYAWQTGWGVKWAIEDQMNGDTALAYSGNNPRVPWMAWGPYIWADGTTPNSDGLTWNCPDDYVQDGTHPSQKGREKVAARLLEFFSKDKTTTPWFLQNTTGIDAGESFAETRLLQNYPNPFSKITIIRFSLPQYLRGREVNATVKVFDVFGKEIKTLSTATISSVNQLECNAENLSPGVYYYQLQAADFVAFNKMTVVE